jgi:archaea-specific RecJ-like exonuclease
MIITNSKVLKQLQPQIVAAATTIQKAIQNRQPIIIRHHNDADGFSAGIALERGILPHLEAKHARERDIMNHYRRLPLMTPFYGYEDATRDMQRATENVERFGTKLPLIIICDTGSGSESLAGLQKATMYGATIIVLDHHPPATQIERYLHTHINPHTVGSNYDYCAGMLAAEVAYELTKDLKNLPPLHLTFIAAVAAIADKVASDEAKEYTRLAILDGFTQERIERVAPALDFEAQTLGPNAGSTMMNDLLGVDQKRQNKLLNIIEKQMKPMLKAQLQSCLAYAKEEKKSFFTLVTVPVAETKQRRSFPGRGKACSLILEHYKAKVGNTIVLGFGKDSCNFRSSSEIKNFDVNALIQHCKEKIPHGQVNGGGHRVAGTMHYIEAAHKEVLEQIHAYLDTLCE